MGAGKSTRSKSHKEVIILHEKLKTDKNIDVLLDAHPNLPKLSFTKLNLNYLHYIVAINNIDLFNSCVASPR